MPLIARQEAKAALTTHYFDYLVARPDEGLGSLTKLTDSNEYSFKTNAVGFFATLLALRGDKEKAKAILVFAVRMGLLVLTDDTPNNDRTEFLVLFLTMLQFQDFPNAGVAAALRG
jgi:hypothetical protein